MDGFVDAVLLLGGNQGDRKELLARAVDLITERVGDVRLRSSLYETEPWGFEAEQNFLNQAVVVATRLSAHAVLEEVLNMEKELGRVRHGKGYSSRTMDIDVMFYGTETYDVPDLRIPHPRLHLRRFVLVPLAEIIPDFVHPEYGKTVSELLDDCPDKGDVLKFGI